MPAADRQSQDAPVTARTKSDQAELAALDATVDRMRTFTAPDPYILTIPQDVEPRYHHAYQYQATQWLHQAPFQWKEGEMTQYQTYVYHEHGKDMYVLHNSRPKEEAAAKSKAGTGINTPVVGAKKKMSLNAYKKKQTGAATPAQEAPPVKPVEAPAKQPAVKGPVERVKAETEEVLAAVAEPDEAPVAARVEKKELKRKRADSGKHDDKPREEPAASEEPASKKARTASPLPPPPPAAEEPETVSMSEQPLEPAESPEKPRTPPATSEDTSLPPKLSPLEVPSLPTRLSPTIPSNIAVTLKAREHLRPDSSESAAPTSAPKSDKLTPVKKADGITKHKSPIPRNGFRANSSSPAVRSDAEEKSRPPTSSAPQPRATTPDLSQDDEIAVGRALKVRKESKPSLIVKMKYKKHQREGIRRLLNMRSKPDKSATPQPAATAIPPPPPPPAPTSAPKTVDEPKPERPSTRKRDPNAKGVAQKIGPATNGAKKKLQEKQPVPEKRPPPKEPEPESKEPPAKRKAAPEATEKATEERPAKRKAMPEETDKASEEPPAKRKKVPEAIETKKDPSTPLQLNLQSPALVSGMPKSQQVTPSIRKDHLSVAMQRELSTDSNVNTPSAKSSTPITNGHTSQPNGVAKPPSSQPITRTSKQQAWGTEQTRLENLGRELKHAATAHLNAVKPTTSSDQPTPSIDQKLAAVKSLESLLAYFLAFTSADEAALAAEPKQNPSIKTWRSLHGFFKFVKQNCEPFPLLLGLACQLGVVYNARIIDITMQFPAERPARDITLETYAVLTKYAADAEASLDVDVLLESFPRTWKRRARGTMSGDVLTNPGEYSGDFKLPISMQTSPLRAARAGHAMLLEWIAKERVEYEMKLRL